MMITATFRTPAEPFAARVRELLDYDAFTGVFVWRVRRNNNNNARQGAVAGTLNMGYVVIAVDDRLYQAHRLAWLWTHGAWPAGHIDHIDGNKANNALANLRDVTRNVNQQNRKRAKRNSTSGFLGVSWYAPSRKWRAQIGLAGKTWNLGLFTTPEDAHARYLAVKREIHEGNTL
jgi:hypothetical protein